MGRAKVGHTADRSWESDLRGRVACSCVCGKAPGPGSQETCHFINTAPSAPRAQTRMMAVV